LLKTAKTEYSIELAHDLMMHSLMSEADAIYEREAALHDAAIWNEDYNDYNAFKAEKQIQDILHKYADILMKNSERKRREKEE